MIEYLNKTIHTINREGIGAAGKKAYRRFKYKLLRKEHPSKSYKEKWASIKDKYKGERVFLIGNGPSLNKTPLYLLENEFTMCFNRFNIMLERLNWQPEFYMITDNLLLDDMVPEINPILGLTEFCFLPDIHFRGNIYIDKIDNDKNVYWLVQKHGRGFSMELPIVHMGGSVIYEGFQVLRHLGISEVYIVGVDMNFKIHESGKSINDKETDIISTKDDDPNHFDPRYFGKNRKYHQPESYVINSILEHLKYLQENHLSEDFKVINAGYDSNVTYFPAVEFETLFNFTHEKKREIINKCFQQNTPFDSVDSFLLSAKALSSAPDEIFTSHFVIEASIAYDLIKRYVFTHVPIGPFEGKYFFVLRDKPFNS
jgi:hypothetical protein